MGGPQWTDDDFQRARVEAARLLGFPNAENLSAADNLKVDLVTSLRAVVDDASASVLEGTQTDLGKLVVAVEHLTKLLPQNQEPASRGADPREAMWQTYLSMRRRGELAASQMHPQQRLEAARAKVAAIEAEIAAGSTSITPPTSDIVPPGEWRGVPPMPGPDDPPKRRPVVIDGKATPAPAAPAANMVDLRAGYSDGPAEPWRDYLNRSFDPWADNRR